MTEPAFRELLNLLMCADPAPCGVDQLKGFANEQSQRLGYADWIEAFHEVGHA